MDQEHEILVRQAADEAVKKMFAILGVNVDEPREVEEFRENLRFGASMRRAADKGLMVTVSVIVVAALSALWVGVINKFTGH